MEATVERGRRLALVTGGSRGIGAAICRRLAADGFEVCVVYRDNAAAATEVVDQIRDSGGQAEARQADVGDEREVAGLVDDLTRIRGAIEVLVNNAGIVDDQLVVLAETDRWEQVLRVNLTAPFLMCRAVVPMMLDEGRGCIVNISSNSVRLPKPGQAAYAASKGGLEALTRTLAAEVGRKGIRINTVAPGKIRTDMTARFLSPRGEETGGGWGRPEDVAGAVAYLSSDAGRYVQGQIITVDGGRSLDVGARGGRR